MSSKPILFYSKKNHNSISLWNKLNLKNQLDLFVKICVDDSNKIPSVVTTVPAVFIKGRPLLTGAAIEMFLESNHSLQPKRVNTVSNNPITQSNPVAGVSNIDSFNPVEMSERWSDSYSFIDSNPEPMSFCYQFLNEDRKTAPNANTNTSGNSGVQVPTKKQSNQLDERLEKLQMERGMTNNSFN